MMRNAFATALVLGSLLCAPPLGNAEPITEQEIAYTRTIEQRTTRIIDSLDLQDPQKTERLRQDIMGFYSGLRDLHDVRDERIERIRSEAGGDAEVEGLLTAQRERTAASVELLRQGFLAKLEPELTPEQMDRVKDGLTDNRLHVNYNAFIQLLPELTEEQKAVILENLKEARDQAIAGGSAREKTQIFVRYRGRINNYLSAQGYDLRAAGQRQRERAAEASGDAAR